MNDFLNLFLDFLLPRFCYNCGNKLTPDELLFCHQCNPKLARVSPERLNREFERKFLNEKIISEFQSLFLFEVEGTIQKVIHEMKYQNSFTTGKKLGQIAAKELSTNISGWKADFIIPVPIHKLRRADRGYNQSFYIAKGVSSILNIPVMPRVVKRRRFTSTQTALNLAERKLNVKDAFIIKRNSKIKGKRIILLDDVITTGATISECGKVLLNAGAEKIFALSIALAE